MSSIHADAYLPGILPFWGEVLSQHQQAFLADKSGDVARVARRVLSMLAAKEVASVQDTAVLETLPDRDSGSALTQQLCAAAICSNPATLSKALQDVRIAGYSNDVLAYDFIPAIARQLGTSWIEDTISFADVTIGCARLQSVLRRLPDEPAISPAAYGDVRHACLVTVPKGAQHTLGALVLAKQLRQARQRVTVELEAQENSLLDLAKKQRFDVVLISASCGECPEVLRALVDVTRQQWGGCRIVLGGSICELQDDVLRRIGADHVTNEWQEALDLCI